MIFGYVVLNKICLIFQRLQIKKKFKKKYKKTFKKKNYLFLSGIPLYPPPIFFASSLIQGLKPNSFGKNTISVPY